MQNQIINAEWQMINKEETLTVKNRISEKREMRYGKTEGKGRGKKKWKENKWMKKNHKRWRTHEKKKDETLERKSVGHRKGNKKCI